MEHNPINSEKATFQSISDISSQETERLPVITEPEIQSHQKKAKYKDIAKKEPYKNIGKKEPYKNIGKKEPYKDIGKKEPYKDIEKKEPYKDILKKEDYKDVSAETSSFGSSPAAFNKDSMDYEIEMLVNDILNDFNSSHDFFDSKSSNAGNQPPNNKLEPIGHSFENSDPDIVHEKTLEDDGSDSKLKLMHKYGVNIESSLNVDEFLNSNVNVSGSLAEFISVVENMPTNDLKEIEALIRKLAFTSKDPNFAMKGIYAIQTMRRINT
ncbi:MAG: hypothetical protein LBU32_23850 [Clostridiales bacterium]|nr:hypothetical protein [Clostridiales bacterium]